MWLLANEQTIRLAAFLGLAALFWLLQSRFPRRPNSASSKQQWLRWLLNCGLVVLNTLAVYLVVPISTTALALKFDYQNAGLLGFQTPFWLAIILLDVLIYWQHRLSHKIPLLWRLHKVHHSDAHIDVSTALRFHPIEIVLSLFLKLAFVALLGISAHAIVCFEVLLSACALFNHSNWHIRHDSLLRRMIVTPDMHRIHHSVHTHETDSNYCTIVPWWDHAFASYSARPKDGQQDMTIGLKQYPNADKANSLWHCLLMPFVKR